MGKIHQVHTTVAASYGMLLCGLLYVWPSYTASHYSNPNTTPLSAPMTDVEISLIGSMPSLGAMLGTILTGKIIDVFGRQKGGLILGLPFLLAWVVIDLTNSSIVILIARTISGFSCGASLVYGPIYISEIAEESIRGFLGSGPVVLYCLGVLLSYLFGWFLTYRYILWCNMALSCLGLANLLMATESPVWLVTKKREADACTAFAHYRGLSPGSKTVLEEISRLKALTIPAVELASINGTVKADESEKEKLKVDEQNVETQENISPLKKLFISTSSRRALIVTGLTLSLQVMMGMIVVQVYAKEIFSKSAPSLSPHLCSVLLAFVLLFGSITSASFSDKFGRRILLIISTVAVVLCLICMGVLLQTNVLPPWVTAVLILVYCYAFMLGSGSVPYVLMGETFVPEVRSTAAMLLMEWVWLLNFLLLGIFPFIVKYFGVHGAFYFFAVFGVIDTCVAAFWLPETKGLTIDQIQEAFLRKRKN